MPAPKMRDAVITCAFLSYCSGKNGSAGVEGMRTQARSEVKGKPGGNPEPGDRLRFVFVFVSCVACVRAGEAKLRVRARCRVFLLTLALAVGSSAAPFAASLRRSGRGGRGVFKAKWVQICSALLSLPLFYVGFMKVLHKTRVYGMGFMANPLKTHMWCISCRTHLIKTHV